MTYCCCHTDLQRAEAENLGCILCKSDRILQLQKVIHQIHLEVDGLIDGSPDAGAESKLANRIQNIIDGKP
jgi:hypothetical protein